jgi:hypothetical protein
VLRGRVVLVVPCVVTAGFVPEPLPIAEEPPVEPVGEVVPPLTGVDGSESLQAHKETLSNPANNGNFDMCSFFITILRSKSVEADVEGQTLAPVQIGSEKCNAYSQSPRACVS